MLKKYGDEQKGPTTYPAGRIKMIVSPATDMANIAALVSQGLVYWLARRTKGLGGAIWGLPIQTRRNRYG
jgi:hypothetical protein